MDKKQLTREITNIRDLARESLTNAHTVLEAIAELAESQPSIASRLANVGLLLIELHGENIDSGLEDLDGIIEGGSHA